MPMIDVYAAKGTFAAKKELTKDLTAAMMRWEGVPPIALFKDNTAAFVHELEPDALGNANGDSNYVRVQILTPVGVLNREKQLGVVKEMTEIVSTAAGDPTLADRTWVLIHESPDGGWGLDGEAMTNADIAAAARRELSSQ
jgi:phenylpyruvate tautomerase PptA (4-oxalocrotonate tautomerase family)